MSLLEASPTHAMNWQRPGSRGSGSAALDSRSRCEGRLSVSWSRVAAVLLGCPISGRVGMHGVAIRKRAVLSYRGLRVAGGASRGTRQRLPSERRRECEGRNNAASRGATGLRRQTTCRGLPKGRFGGIRRERQSTVITLPRCGPIARGNPESIDTGHDMDHGGSLRCRLTVWL
jgi:hypothetical protein